MPEAPVVVAVTAVVAVAAVVAAVLLRGAPDRRLRRGRIGLWRRLLPPLGFKTGQRFKLPVVEEYPTAPAALLDLDAIAVVRVHRGMALGTLHRFNSSPLDQDGSAYGAAPGANSAGTPAIRAHESSIIRSASSSGLFAAVDLARARAAV